MKKLIKIKQENCKIDFTKIKKINYVESTKEGLFIEVELKDGKKDKE